MMMMKMMMVIMVVIMVVMEIVILIIGNTYITNIIIPIPTASHDGLQHYRNHPPPIPPFQCWCLGYMCILALYRILQTSPSAPSTLKLGGVRGRTRRVGGGIFLLRRPLRTVLPCLDCIEI